MPSKGLDSTHERTIGLWLHGASGRMGVEIRRVLSETPSPPRQGGETQPKWRFLGGSGRVFEGDPFHQGRPVTAELLARELARKELALLLDFSTVEGNELLLRSFQLAAKATPGDLRGKALVIGTTGLPPGRLPEWEKLAAAESLRLLIAPNTSIGVLVLLRAALASVLPLSRLGFDIEMTETHHRHKRDAPSGTATFLANALADASRGSLNVTTSRTGARAPGELGVHAVRGGGIVGEHEIRILGDHEELTLRHRALSRSLFASGALVLGRWLLAKPSGIYGLGDVELLEGSV